MVQEHQIKIFSLQFEFCIHSYVDTYRIRSLNDLDFQEFDIFVDV